MDRTTLTPGALGRDILPEGPVVPVSEGPDMATKNRVGHGDRKAPVKSLKEKRREKRSKRLHQSDPQHSVEKVFSHSG